MKLSVHERIKEFRRRKKLSQVALAKKLGITNCVLSDFETGKLYPGIRHIKKLNKLGANMHLFVFLHYVRKATMVIRNIILGGEKLRKIMREKTTPPKYFTRARFHSSGQPLPPERLWIRHQLVLRCIKLKTIAKKANRSISMVSLVIAGVKNSEAVGLALAQILGYATYEELMDTAHRQTKKGAA